MKVYLDNIPVYNLTDGLKKPSFTYRKQDETGDNAFSFTGELTFTGKDYDYLYAQLVTSANALENKVVLKFVNDCCSTPQIREFFINHESLIWCENSCDITAAAIEKSLSNDQYTCLKNTLIWDDRFGFKSKQHPRMSYCNELRPNWMGDLMIIITLALYTAFLTMGPVLALIALIIDGINLIININNDIIGALNSLLPSGSEIDLVDPIDLDGDPSTTTFQQFSDWIDSLLALGVGCGRKHPSPLVRDYAENVCKVCGISFVSSILNNPANEYFWLVYINAPVHKGVPEADTTTFWVDENAPILSGLQFFDQLAIVFNAKFEISNNQLIFERKDFFVPKTPWLDLTTHPGVIKVCWNWSHKNRYSYANLRYQKDAINTVGNEAVPRWGEIVEWNPQTSYSPLQKGAYEPLIPFAACRFRDDGIDRDILTFYEDQPTINTLILRYKDAIIMNQHTSYLPMLVIWDPASGVSNAFANKFTNIYFPSLVGVVSANQYYNYPMWFKEGVAGNLLDRFHEIENPRTSGYQGFEFEAEVEFDCDLLTAQDIEGVVKTSRGDSKGNLIITENHANNTLIIKGTV